MAKTPEGVVKDSITDLLDKFGIVYSMKTTMGFGKSGWPDYDVVLRGIYVTVEAKYDAATKGPTALQRDAMKSIRESGGITLVIDMTNLVQFNGFLTNVMAMDDMWVSPSQFRAAARKWNIMYEEEVYASK